MESGWRRWLRNAPGRGATRSARSRRMAFGADETIAAPGAKLNVGCGRAPLAGWINADVQALPGVDRVFDVRRGIPYRQLAVVFAEHFLEHLTFREAIHFLRHAHAALAPGGALRLSTPNLVWVWYAHDVRPAGEEAPAARFVKTFEANRAFYGWQHRFLWTRELLGEAVAACGFEEVRFALYGESENPELRGLEQHDRYPDSPGVEHVLIAEGRRGAFDGKRLDALLATAQASFLDHLDG